MDQVRLADKTDQKPEISPTRLCRSCWSIDHTACRFLIVLFKLIRIQVQNTSVAIVVKILAIYRSAGFTIYNDVFSSDISISKNYGTRVTRCEATQGLDV